MRARERRLRLLVRGCPAGEEVQRLLGLWAGLGGEDGDGEARVGRERHRLVGQLEIADESVMDALDTGVRGGPDPDSITLEAYGIEIPEA